MSKHIIQFHVATTGHDRAEGTAERPFRTLRRAREAVRAVLRDGTGTPRVTVHQGVYHLTRTLEFGPEDSGTAASPVIWAAAAGATVTIVGGRELAPSWRVHRGPVRVADIGTGLDFDQLFVDGRRQTLARYPSLRPGDILGGHAADALSAERVARWRHPETALVRALHQAGWGGNSYRVTGVRDGEAQLEWVGDNNRGSGMHTEYRMVENVFEELDSPGEWFYDREAGALYLSPPNGVDLSSATVWAGEVDELIRVVGTSERKAGGLTFAGFTLTATHRTLFSRAYEKLQLGDWAVARAGAVRLRNAEHVRVENIRFVEVGGNAVFIDGHNTGHVVTGCDFAGSGASDVLAVGSPEAVRSPSTWDAPARAISDTTPGPRSEDYPRAVTISANHMSGCGVYEKQSAAVHLSMSHRITVRGNTIHDVPRAGVNINDGTWGGHLIEGNDIFDCVLETSDHGPINGWGRDRFWPLDADDATRKRFAGLDAIDTTVIRANRIWHSQDWAVDLDDGCSNYEVTGNLFLGAGVKLREGFHRRVTGNMFVGGATHHHVSYAGNEDVIAHNVFLGPEPYQFIRSDPTAGRTVHDHNVFWNDGEEVRAVTHQWRDNGFDVHSLIADPHFTSASPWQDPAAGHYELADSSPAFALGFTRLPASYGVPGAPTPPQVTWNHAVPVDQLEVRPLLGATTTGIENELIKSATGLHDHAGLYLASVPNYSAAFLGGLRANDVIRELGGQPVAGKAEFWALYEDLPPGRPVELGIWRDQAPVTVTLTLPA